MAIALIIVGIACALYGIAVMMIGSGTWFFALWYALGALLIAAGVAVQFGWWQALPLVVKRTVEAVAVVMFCVFLATQVLIFGDFDDRGEDDLDYVIVLGAQVHEWGPSVVLKHRLDAAYDYLVENGGTTCIVSGGQGHNEYTAEANVMAAYLIERGIPEERIIVEDQSLNTAQNIAYSSRFIDVERDRVGLITNNFHAFRALAIARKAGIAHACGIAAGSTPFFLPNNLVRESLGIAKDFIVGNL